MEKILGIGIDIIRIERIRRLRQRYPRFAQKVFTESEISYCTAKADPDINFSARFAAKEALVKALGRGIGRGISWKNIEVFNDTNGRPSISLKGKIDGSIDIKKIKDIHLSISHDQDYALAFCLLEG